MRTRGVGKALVTGAFALAVSAIGCGEGNRRYDDTVGTSGRDASENKSVTLSGCLQRGDGADFILTQADASSGEASTSGSSSDRGSVEQQQRAQASRSYRLGGDSEELRDLVGQRVRVMGTLEDRGDLSEDDRQTSDRTAVGTTGDRDRDEIDERDLARVDVSSVESIAKTCGTSGQR